MRYTKDSFRWDDFQNQPHNDLTRGQKLWGSRRDVAPLGRLVWHNLRQLLPVLRHFRSLSSAVTPPRVVLPAELGVAISPTPDTWERYEERVRTLGVRSLLLRVPVWAPEPVLELVPHLEKLHAEGTELTFVLVQDREAVTSPGRWSAFVGDVVTRLAALRPTFQVGQALNRKKWGIWNPDEYLRLVEGVARARERGAGCRFIGPPVIDFEYHYTIDYLARRRPFDFDGITSLLYVDRRGSPDATQYGQFDLRRKIELLHAIVAASPHPLVPIYLTEFNWPLSGHGAWAPAGHAVQIDEARQARYLAIYFLTAAATGLVAASFWWQLVARGYGLVADDAAWTERPAFRVLATLVRRVVGARISRLPEHLEPVRGWLLERDGVRTAVAYTVAGEARITNCEAVQEACSVLGEAFQPRDLRLGQDPAYLSFGVSSEASVLEALTPRTPR